MLSSRPLNVFPPEELNQGEDDPNKVKYPCKHKFQSNLADSNSTIESSNTISPENRTREMK